MCAIVVEFNRNNNSYISCHLAKGYKGNLEGSPMGGQIPTKDDNISPSLTSDHQQANKEASWRILTSPRKLRSKAREDN